jgi:hypothetical protein
MSLYIKHFTKINSTYDYTLRWEDGVKKEVEKIEPGVKWREVAEDRDRWQNLVFSGWS